jgi:hypothetical protein
MTWPITGEQLFRKHDAETGIAAMKRASGIGPQLQYYVGRGTISRIYFADAAVERNLKMDRVLDGPGLMPVAAHLHQNDVRLVRVNPEPDGSGGTGIELWDLLDQISSASFGRPNR